MHWLQHVKTIEPGFLNKFFDMYPLEDDCQEDQIEDDWRP
jgi:hypothetical protein